MNKTTAALLVITALALISLGVRTIDLERDDPAAAVSERVAMASDVIVQLEIRNGSGVPGLAADLSLMLGRVGATAVLLANAPHDGFAESMLVNRRLDDAEAARLAAALGGLPVLREFDPASSSDAVLVLGADHDLVRSALLEAAPRR